MSIRDKWTSGADYDLWMGRWSRLVAQEFLKWLNIPAGLRWIDVCCGSGVLSEAIAERNEPASVVGVDVSAEQINYARQHRAGANLPSKQPMPWPCHSPMPALMLLSAAWA